MVTLARKKNSSLCCGGRSIHLLALIVLLSAVGFLYFFDATVHSEKDAALSLLLLTTLTRDDPFQRSNEKKHATLLSSTKRSNDNKNPVVVKIAHAVSLISCAKASRVQGFLDALMILRHSIHRNSVHYAAAPNNYATTSAYSYQMFAFVHEHGGCVQHVPLLKRLGYIPLIRPTPVNVSAITTNDWYRDHVKTENCCGDAEFIKLYAYQLTEYPIVVHWDLDVAVLQPMDDLFDAMLFDKDSAKGRAARERLQIQNNNPGTQVVLPDRIDAFLTRDVTSAKPWERVRAVQGGFVVARPNVEHFRLYQEFIMQANYTPGRGPFSGWGGIGYGGFQGAMAYQGVLAYFYDQIYPDHAVELDVCRWNQVVADVIYRGPERPDMVGQCRQYPEDGNFDTNTPENGKCEDCRVVPIDETKTVHFTACKKPWECSIPHPRVPAPRMKAHAYRLRELTNITTCGLLFRKYFDIRNEVESLIASSLGVPQTTPRGEFRPEYFRGYCKGKGTYIPMEDVIPVDFNMQQVYGL
jgi:hypothetical protein